MTDCVDIFAQVNGSPCSRIGCCACVTGTWSKVSCSENNRTFIINNLINATITKIHLDGGAILSGASHRCDYIVVVHPFAPGGNPAAFLVELKGTDIYTAGKQLLETLKRFFAKGATWKVDAVIVASSVNARVFMNDAVFIRLRAALKQYNGQLHVKSRKLELPLA